MMNNRVSAPELWGRELTNDEIHIWYASLDQPISLFQKLLSNDEKIRAGRFRFEKDRKSFIVRRGILRKILGYYLNIEPNEVHFCYNENGKPALSNEISNGNLN